MNTNDPEKTAHECGVAYHNAIKLREFERAVERRARTLTAGRPPEFNLAPTIELVRRAWFMGYDIVNRDDDAV